MQKTTNPLHLDRRFRVRIGDVFSEGKEQDMGVPLGNVLSVTQFYIKIDDIVKNINSRTNCDLYADDFLICYRARNMNHIERQLQICLDNLNKWTTENGLKFSKEKRNVSTATNINSTLTQD